MIETNSNETKCMAPNTVQPALDKLMEEIAGSRTFIRPSGTEDVVRIYAEASAQTYADILATKAARVVYSLCDGVGEPPEFAGHIR